MKNLFTFLLLLITTTSIAQFGNASYTNVTAKNKLTVGGKSVTSISDDSSLVGNSHVALVTEYAVKNFLQNHIAALSISTSHTFVVASQAAMLALAAGVGDVAIRTDDTTTYILQSLPASTLGNWVPLLSPTSPVLSWNGRVGDIIPQVGDYAFSDLSVHPTTLAGYGITDAFTVGIANTLYEPLFGHNTAFNKNYGTASGTTAEGNDSRILNGQIAFGWGNHASAGYYKASNFVANTDYLSPIVTTPGTFTKLTLNAFGQITGGVAATTSDIAEGSNQYFTLPRARTSISLTTLGSGAATYNSGTGILNIPIVSGGGGGSVVDFIANNLSGFFTTSVATSTSTPTISFTIVNAGAHVFWGNNTGSTGAPSYVQINKADVNGIGNIDNTSDANKPISTAAQNAFNLKADQTSISNINNTSDANKPISTATANALALKATIQALTDSCAALRLKLGQKVDTSYRDTTALGQGLKMNLAANPKMLYLLANDPGNINAQVGTTYTLLASDGGKVITMNNAAAITLTIPASLGAGFNCTIIQMGAGQVTFAASGTVLRQADNLTKTAKQYAKVTLIAVAANTFVLDGKML